MSRRSGILDKYSRMNNGTITISVIIATYARPQQLERCLSALSHSDFDPSGWEVIVVDDGSPEGMDFIIERFSQRLNLRLIKQLNAGPAAARNKGASLANGKYLAFTDDDCLPDSLWLASLVARLESNSTSLVGGRIINSLKHNIHAATSQLLIDYLYEHYHSESRTGAFLSSNNLACSAKAFWALGGFDSRFAHAAAEDRDLSARWVESGRALFYSPQSIVYHAHDLRFSDFIRQHCGYGRGAFHYHSLRAGRIRRGIRVEPFKFYCDLLAYPFKTNSSDRAKIASLLIVSQICNAFGFFSQAFMNKRRMSAVQSEKLVCEQM